MNRSKIIRKFERFVFQGVPERPETVYQRNDYASYTIRHTGKTNTPLVINDIITRSKLLGYTKDDPINQTETYIKVES